MAKSKENDKQYINYNLSLIDPQSIDVTGPIEVKLLKDNASGYVVSEDDFNLVPASLGTNFKLDNAIKENILTPDENKTEINLETLTPDENKTEINLETLTPDENKTEIDLTDFVKNENKPANGGSLKTLSFATLALAREFPLEPINGKFKTHIAYDKNKALNNAKSIAEAAAIADASAMKDFEVTDENLGKDNTATIQIKDLTKVRFKDPYKGTELNYQEVIRKLNVKEQVSNLGSIHVYPVNTGAESGISSKYIIPFEFNPNISESGREAKFEATSLLSRLGNIDSYINTGALSIELNTKYQVLTVDPNTNRSIGSTGDGNSYKGDNSGTSSWMDPFHLRNIQSIEMAYRGLVYPQISKDSSAFFRPPLVKIVFNGGADGKIIDNNASAIPFNNLLTYPYRFSNSTKTYHRSFIVSKVDIKKDWDNMPVVLNENYDGFLDLQGFEVSLSLIEVDPMYIGVLPSFEDYYSIAKNVTA